MPDNRLLSALSPADRQLLDDHLHSVMLERGQTLFKPGEDVVDVHFPEGATIAALEAQSCECYGRLRRHFDRILPGVMPVV